MIPKCVQRLEAPRVQLVAEEFDAFTEDLLHSCSLRIPSLHHSQEDCDSFRKTVTEAIGRLQRPRLVFDERRDIIDWIAAHFQWVHGTNVIPSLTLSTVANQENPCIECRAGKFPFCVCGS